MPPGNPPPYGPPSWSYNQPPSGPPGPYPPPPPPLRFPAPPPYYGPPPKKTRWGLIIGLVAGAVALLAVAAIVFVAIIGKGTVTTVR